MEQKLPTDNNCEKFEAWGLLELFGHQRLAGKLTEQSIGGVHFIRVDVPAIDGSQAYTRMFTQGAIYGMTILTEDTARRLAANLRAAPVSAYDVQPVERRLPAPSHTDEDDHDEDDDARF
jgi:hypothetical protein